MRGGFPSVLTRRLTVPPVEFFRVVSVDVRPAEEGQGGEEGGEEVSGMLAVIQIRRDTRLQNAYHEENVFARNLAVSMHAIHSIPLAGVALHASDELSTSRFKC